MISPLIENQRTFLLDVGRLIAWSEVARFVVTAGELWRPPEMQELYFKLGKSKVRAGGNHGRRLAVDLNIFLPSGTLATLAQIEPMGLFWESLHPLNRWGGHFSTIKDGPHFERNFLG